ncbi:hypothetical protein DXV75_09865 [Alteromonas aestuariivivens]|uniref:Peptide ABC transporter permease n=1 Tax=Alteromonas aestuariivivens TaxID=1938339 RepID=A0A3D8M734_9ALTE|nr:SapC family protein [Alteromonas aestuariivivens]RDV25586.1 hypothetical protein DXV75_09865 [Alteromonas aestuariivivens]
MTDLVLLDNLTHKDLRVVTRYSADFGDNIASTLTFPTEFANVEKEYPILLHKSPQSSQFQAVALFGLERGENLFLSESSPLTNHCGSWQASYVPAMIAKGPFVIGMHNNGNGQPNAMIHIDMDSPRINQSEGKAVFLPHGGNSDYLNHVSRLLGTIHDGMQSSAAMYAAFEKYDLIEPLSIDITLINGDAVRIGGHYTISEEKLAQLPAHALFELNQNGFLQGAFLIVASLTNMRKLIDMKNARLQNANY